MHPSFYCKLITPSSPGLLCFKHTHVLYIIHIHKHICISTTHIIHIHIYQYMYYSNLCIKLKKNFRKDSVAKNDEK